MALEFWAGLCYIEQDNPSSKTINVIAQSYESILAICFMAFETELKSEDPDIDMNEDSEFSSNVAFQGLNLAQNVVVIVGKPACEIINKKAEDDYSGKDSW